MEKKSRNWRTAPKVSQKRKTAIIKTRTETAKEQDTTQICWNSPRKKRRHESSESSIKAKAKKRK